MIGSTGIGKTEIARRLAALANAPFIKVEASKFTEVGYVGRDVESIVRDLMDTAVAMVEREKYDEVMELAEHLANERIIDILFPDDHKDDAKKSSELRERHKRTRSRIRKKLELGEFEEKLIEIEVSDEPSIGMQVFGPMGMEDIGMNIKDMISSSLPKNKRSKKMTVMEAREVLTENEASKLIDQDEVVRLAKERTENNGIVFLDELDIVAKRSENVGADVSREGVQRDLLPLIEGCTVSTKYGMIRTDHVLFIASGAFHLAKPSDLIPELQGRLPIRVELSALTPADFKRILTEPDASLTEQYKALLATEGVHVEFTEDSLERLAELSWHVNENTENIGARRLHTVMERLMDEISFNAGEAINGEKVDTLQIDAQYVDTHLKELATNQDLSRYIL